MIHRAEWAKKLEELRFNKMISLVDFAKEIGISFITYKKIIDNQDYVLSYCTLRKIQEYLEAEELNGND